MGSEPYVDVRATSGPQGPGARYTSGLTFYQEGLVEGRWMALNLSPTGIVDAATPVLGPLALGSAFGLEMDGDSLHRGWRLEGCEEAPAERPGQRHMVVQLAHQTRPVALRVHTVVDGTPVLMRWLEVTNMADRPAALSSVWVWSGRIAPAPVGADVRGSCGPYSLGSLTENESLSLVWGGEGDFRWQPIGSRTMEIQAEGGMSGWGHPIAYVRDEGQGRVFVAQLAWSGNWRIRLEPRLELLFLRIGPAAPGPMRVLDAGETVSTPVVHLGCMCGDASAMAQALHEHQRRSVIVLPPAGAANLVTYNNWGYMQDEMTEDVLKREIDIAAQVGAEIFTVDAGWFGDPGVSWGTQMGNWRPGSRLPGGLAPVFDYARSKGLRCGLWCAVEVACADSDVIRAHPDWPTQRDGRKLKNTLDLSKPEVAEWVEGEIVRLVQEHGLDLFRLDYGDQPGEGGYNARHGHAENTLWRYYEAVYGIWDRVRARFPHLILENCAGGGGRTDLGLMSRMHYAWISDMAQAPRAVRMQEGMLMALAPELLERVVGVCLNAHVAGDLDMQLRMNMLMGNPCISGLWPSAEEPNAELLRRVTAAVGFFKEHVRPMIRTCRVFHTSEPAEERAGGWSTFEYASPDGSKAILGVFRLAGPGEDDRRVVALRGVSRSRDYCVTSHSSGDIVRIPGRDLVEEGLRVRLPHPLTSELIVAQAV